jgi:hypothetical protein
VPYSPTKVGNITRRKSVMNLGFNSTPTRRESSYSIKQQVSGTQPQEGGASIGYAAQDSSTLNTLMSPEK